MTGIQKAIAIKKAEYLKKEMEEALLKMRIKEAYKNRTKK